MAWSGSKQYSCGFHRGSVVAHVTPCRSVWLGGGHKIGHSRAPQLSKPSKPPGGHHRGRAKECPRFAESGNVTMREGSNFGFFSAAFLWEKQAGESGRFAFLPADSHSLPTLSRFLPLAIYRVIFRLYPFVPKGLESPATVETRYFSPLLKKKFPKILPPLPAHFHCTFS